MDVRVEYHAILLAVILWICAALGLQYINAYCIVQEMRLLHMAQY
jgi:hypothetical protein